MSYDKYLPIEPYGDFRAMVQGEYDYIVEAFAIESSEEYGTMLVLGAQEGAIYITREQAKAFFDL